MSANAPPGLSPRDVVRLLLHYRWRWFVPASVIALAVAAYAAIRPDTWNASQALAVRNEAAGNEGSPGKFARTEDLKALQETLVELARNRQVLAAALADVGSPAARRASWPTARDVDDLRKEVKLTPPGGVEFGQSDVVYLQVRDHDRQRAVALNRAIFRHLQRRLQELRDAKATSMILEMEKAVAVARGDLDRATDDLHAVESRVGPQLAELRLLNESINGDSALRRTFTEIRAEIRQVSAARDANRELLGLLREAQADPSRLLATPNRLLESQPSLRRLKEGLVDAQLRTATLLGRMSPEHPLVQSSRQAEAETAQHLYEEIPSAINGVQVDLHLADEQLARLEKRLAEANSQMASLAGQRAEYANLSEATRHRSALVRQAEQDLAEARASQASAASANLLARIGEADTGAYPVGPGRTLTALAGLLGGLVLGIGIVFLTAETDRKPTAETSVTMARPLWPALSNLTHEWGAVASERVLSLKEALRRIN